MMSSVDWTNVTDLTSDSVDALYVEGLVRAQASLARQADGSMDYEAGLEDLRDTWLAIKDRVAELADIRPTTEADLSHADAVLSKIESLADLWKKNMATQMHESYRGQEVNERHLPVGQAAGLDSEEALQQAVAGDSKVIDSPVPTESAGQLSIPRSRGWDLLGIAIWLPVYIGFFAFGIAIWLVSLGLIPTIAMIALAPILEMLEGLTGRELNLERYLPASTLQSVLLWFAMATLLTFVAWAIGLE